ncbi:MAG: PIN domain-containing protein [Phycisphaeraceae bacterium]|nr:PIN domain-containing protein [Phycisphaeraceae bacterium]
MIMLYVDTNAWLAKSNQDDNLFNHFQPAWEQVVQKNIRLITTNEVIAETLNRLAQRESPIRAAEFGRLLINYSRLTIEQVTREDQLASFKLLDKFTDQDIGYTDCTSFAVMQRLGLQRVFTHDHHFSVAGFELWPGPVRKRRKRR